MAMKQPSVFRSHGGGGQHDQLDVESVKTKTHDKQDIFQISSSLTFRSMIHETRRNSSLTMYLFALSVTHQCQQLLY
eukprot:SAG25_NODE_242_length_11160_cov_254.065546_1_plen_77_part_00